MGKIVAAVRAVVMVMGAVCLLAACGGGGGAAGGDGTVASSVQSQGVRHTLSAKAVSVQGENIELTFTTTNTGTTPLDMTSAQATPRMLVYDKDGTEVWDSLSDTTTPAFRNSDTLAPGASYNYVVTWDQTNNAGGNGAAVVPGMYLIKATGGASSVQIAITVSEMAAPANSLTIIPEGNGVFIVRANNLSGVAAMDLTIGYDSSRLSSPTVTQGAFFSGALFAATTATPGVIRIALASATPFSGSGLIAIIDFQVSARNQVIPIISSVTMVDSSGRPVR